jgi:hypothetical protein
LTDLVHVGAEHLRALLPVSEAIDALEAAFGREPLFKTVGIASEDLVVAHAAVAKLGLGEPPSPTHQLT